jgi:hypothetical protein
VIQGPSNQGTNGLFSGLVLALNWTCRFCYYTYIKNHEDKN